MEYQTTILKPVTVSGKGLHTGKTVTITLLPAEANYGIVFHRTDTDVLIPALVENVTDVARGTTISKDGSSVATLEHLMAAIHALKLDNLLIDISEGEVPILDGSAEPWVKAIREVGIKQLNEKREYWTTTEVISFQCGDSQYWVEPSDSFKVTAVIDFKEDAIGKQMAEIEEFKDFETEIAPCRTFVFFHEIEALLSMNLIKGGDLENAIVFVTKPIQEESKERLARIFNKDLSDIHVNNGILNTIQLRFDNEPARHKLLDFIGDIALLGKFPKGNFTIYIPGHKGNTQFANQLK